MDYKKVKTKTDELLKSVKSNELICSSLVGNMFQDFEGFHAIENKFIILVNLKTDETHEIGTYNNKHIKIDHMMKFQDIRILESVGGKVLIDFKNEGFTLEDLY